MHFVDRHREKIRQSPMSSRLLWACLLLVVVLLLTVGAALFLFASLHNTCLLYTSIPRGGRQRECTVP